jgi:chlorobactene glucosyltransferase
MDLALASIWLAFVSFLLLHAFRQRNVFDRISPRLARSNPRHTSIGVVVPARDEAANVRACLESVLQQQLPHARLDVVLVDDHSADATLQIAESIAASDPRVTVVRAPPLPPGWAGKVHACCCGVAVLGTAVEWLCFLDADMRAHPLMLNSAVDYAMTRQIDLLSLAPRHQLESFAERLILPCGHYLLAFCQNLEKRQAPGGADAVATGQFMLLRRTAYEYVGGYEEIRGSVCEDVELARRMKRFGHRVLMVDGSALVSTRMYTGWGALWPGIARNLTDMLGGPTRTLIIAMLAPLVAWLAVVLPVVYGLECVRDATQSCVGLILVVLGSSALIALHIVGAAHFGIPLRYGLVFPLGYSIGALIALDSIRCRLFGGVRWKGRTYP